MTYIPKKVDPSLTVPNKLNTCIKKQRLIVLFTYQKIQRLTIPQQQKATESKITMLIPLYTC
jgi:hypothetical protein